MTLDSEPEDGIRYQGYQYDRFTVERRARFTVVLCVCVYKSHCVSSVGFTSTLGTEIQPTNGAA